MPKKLIQGLLIGGLSACAAVLVWMAGYTDDWENTSWNWRVQFWARPGPATDQIKIILLDQKSLDWGRVVNKLPWPWPREVYQTLIGFCQRGGAKAIAFDVLYTEDSIWGVADDETFGQAIAAGPPFTVAVMLGEVTGDFTGWPDYAPRYSLPIEGLEEWLERVDTREVVMPRAVFPIPEVAQPSTILADVKGSPDRDSIVRRMNVFRVFDGVAVPSLGLAAYVAASDPKRTGALPRMYIEGNWLHIGNSKLHLDRHGRTILRYRGETGTHEKFPAAQIIESEINLQSGVPPEVSPEKLKDAYVFFGFSAPGLFDLRPTPISPITPGVEIHATILDNLLANEFMSDAAPVQVILVTIVLALAGGLGVRLTKKAWHSVVVCVLLLPVPWALGYGLYLSGIWWPIIAPEAGLALALISAVVVNYATEGRQKAFIKSAFKHYLSPAVIEQILDDPSQLQLGGERRTLSIFFSDLQGFSSISEKMEPQDLTKLLNDYLTDMTDIILEEGGTLDKYEGDAIIAFWNAPLHQPDHALRACRTALRCQRKLDERRAEFRERSGVELRMRIGINTGDVVVGNMGSRERFDYTVLGDAANLASRLEGANKPFGSFTMVAEETWKGARNELFGREIGQIRVVGRKTPVRVFEVRGRSDDREDWIVGYEKALKHCYDRQWKEALQLFEQWPDDPVSARYAQRCRTLIDDPSQEWDGIWNLTEK